MKQIFILIYKTEQNNIDGLTSCFEKREMYQYQADSLNSSLTDLIWVLLPNQ